MVIKNIRVEIGEIDFQDSLNENSLMPYADNSIEEIVKNLADLVASEFIKQMKEKEEKTKSMAG